MNYQKKLIVEPGSKVSLAKIDPSYSGKHKSHKRAMPDIDKQIARMDRLQYLLYADANKSLLIVLQGLDAAGKDGVIRHLFTGMNPQGTAVVGFKQPNALEAAHDFLWRVHTRAPANGEVVIFNRSHYEDVLVVRVHKLVPRSVWSKRYELINDFEEMLSENRTRILKFYLHISPDEQLERFEKRLDDPGGVGRLVKAIIPSANFGRNTSRLMRTLLRARAPNGRRGTSFRRITSGFAIWRFRT